MYVRSVAIYTVHHTYIHSYDVHTTYIVVALPKIVAKIFIIFLEKYLGIVYILNCIILYGYPYLNVDRESHKYLEWCTVHEISSR